MHRHLANKFETFVSNSLARGRYEKVNIPVIRQMAIIKGNLKANTFARGRYENKFPSYSPDGDSKMEFNLNQQFF